MTELKEKAKIIFAGRRQCFYRNEAPVFVFDLMNFTPHDLKNCRLTVKFGADLSREVAIPHFSTFKNDVRIEFPAGMLKHGWYELRTELSGEEGVLARDCRQVGIAREPDRNRVRLWHWPATVHYNALEAGWDIAARQLDELAELGYDWAQFRAGWALWEPEKAARLIEYAMMLGIELGILIENAQGGMFRMTPDLPPDAELIDADGKNTGLVNAHDPRVREYCRMRMDHLMQLFREFPSCTTVFMNSEVEDRLKLSFNPETRKMHEAALGFPLDGIRCKDCIFAAPLPDGKFILPGVIRDDDPEYLYAKYYFKSGDGFVTVNTAMGDIAHQYRPDMVTISDPMRNCSVYGRFGGVDAVSSWTYTNPDPKATLFIETLRREAGHDSKEFIHTITLWNYAGSLVPSGKDRFAREQTLRMEPDRFTEIAWLNFSRAPLAVGTYFGSPLEFFFKQGDPFIYSPETETALKEFARSVLRPFGELMRRTVQSRRDIAVLDSFASRVYGVSPRPYNHYPNYAIYNFYTLLNMAHLPADVIFDETVMESGLDGYKILVLPVCDTLPETVYRRILAFAEQGGTVIADQYLRAEIPGVIRFDFDFEYRKRVNANANTRKCDFTVKDDTNFRKEWETAPVEGVPADRDQQILEEYTARLRDVTDILYSRRFDCSSPRILLNSRESGGVHYLAAVNDHRTFGDRVGQWRSMLEKGLPETGVFTLHGFDCEPDVYELTSHRKLEVSAVAKRDYCFEFTLSPASGAVFAVYPKQKPILRLIQPCVNRFRVETGFTAGLQPLKVEITLPDGSPYDCSGYAIAENGMWETELKPALNEPEGEWTVGIEDLTTGGRVSAKIPVAREPA